MHERRLGGLSTVVASTTVLAAVALSGCDSKPSITVEPGSNLHDGQTVVVTLEHFAPHATVTVRQCPMGADLNDPAGCGADGVPLETDADGSARVTLTLRQRLSHFHEGHLYEADCQYRGYCGISATGVPAADWAPLHFANEIVPVTTAHPTSGLNGLNAPVTLTNSNLPPGAQVAYLQCLTGADRASGCQVVGGSASSDVVVLTERFFPGSCDAPGKCELRTIVNGVYEIGRIPLSFDAGPTSHVTPTTDLQDNQEVIATGLHIPDGATVEFAQCLLGAGTSACEVLGQVGPVSEGTYGTALNVRRTLAGGSCELPARCEIRARLKGAEQFGAHALTFVPAPRISIQPSTNLDAIARVTVSGKVPPSYADIYQCVGDQTDTCYLVGSAAADAAGTFSLSVEVRQTYRGGVCDTPGKCQLALFSSGVRLVSAPLSFKRVGPLALGTLEAAASVTTAGAPLSVVGRNWASNTAVQLGLSPSDSSWPLGYRIADVSGSFSHALSVRGYLVRDLAPVWFPVDAGHFKDLRDCVSVPGSCAIVAHDFRATSPSVRIPLTVQSGASATGVASIEQAMPLPHASFEAVPVFMTGSGWEANRALEVHQCASDLRLCIAMPAITTDAAGAFRVQRDVYYGATNGSPESGYQFSCEAPRSCLVLVADSRAGLAAAARIPLSFAGSGGG